MNFYEGLSPFTEFNHLTNSSYFYPVPGDWVVFITDVKGSTKAIKEGRYKDVNTIGAASIVAARKGMDREDFPFVFGGDGATLIIPQTHADAVANELCALKTLALANYALELRVGMVKMAELRASGLDIQMAKYEMTKGRSIAILRGDGLNKAEEWIKSGDSRFQAVESKEIKTDLTGLSCRWQPIPSKNGKILTLIVLSRKGNTVYEQILERLQKIFPEGMDSLNPVSSPSHQYKTITQCVQEEYKYHPSLLSLVFLKRFLEIILAVIIFKWKLPIPFFSRYANSMASHSDYRKFDNTLRMVIDCSLEGVHKVKELLGTLYMQGTLYYGTFESENSLMTCFVEGLNQGEHIHFVDSENGGYAMAALEMKKQMKEQVSVPN
jgi:hypothetical protein